MPSTIVHLAFAFLIATALLGEALDRRAILVVMLVTAVPDLDSVIALYAVAGHRTVLHNLAIPVAATVALYIDLRLRDRSLVRTQWGAWGARVAWVSVFCYVFAHVGLDLVDGVANLFWPVHDQFYRLSGSIELSDQRGVVQTFADGDGFLLFERVGTTSDVDITTGVDPDPAGVETDPERMFPIIGAGWELIVVLTAMAVSAVRFRRSVGDRKID